MCTTNLFALRSDASLAAPRVQAQVRNCPSCLKRAYARRRQSSLVPMLCAQWWPVLSSSLWDDLVPHTWQLATEGSSYLEGSTIAGDFLRGVDWKGSRFRRCLWFFWARAAVGAFETLGVG